MNQFKYEQELGSKGVKRIAGVDEAGRGPLAGPVVAAAVILPEEWRLQGMPESLLGLNDSKKLSAKQRDRYFEAIVSFPGIQFGIAQVSAEVIDSINILQATYQAMKDALAQLSPSPEHILVDGNPAQGLPYPQTAIVKGDSLSYSIAAASILAKVTRDRQMLDHAGRWPEYGFAEHKGYGTAKHLEALARHGPCPIHRRSFAPIKPAPAQVQQELF